MPPLRVKLPQGLPYAVGPGWEHGIGQDRRAARAFHDIGNFTLRRGDSHGADTRGNSAVKHMDNHGTAGNVGKRFARQPGRGHPGRNQDNGIHGIWVWAIRICGGGGGRPLPCMLHTGRAAV
ncbi:hypothetical protein AA18890_0156 [Komagataeibacter europaeus LMG 18890]|nr:hypothetical protein AA18890_0156 [Komagataeibacter europaeus LMG 18890]